MVCGKWSKENRSRISYVAICSLQLDKMSSAGIERSDRLKIVDEELLSFYQYCEQAGFSQSEMEVICAPLTSAFRQRAVKKIIKIGLFITGIIIFIYATSEAYMYKNHFHALSRLAMIKLLPFWDWTSMFYKSCLISNPFFKSSSLDMKDCISCESFEKIERISEVSFNNLVDDYISRDLPVIVEDAMFSWPIMNTDYFYFQNITDAYLNNEKLYDTVPCVLVSNIRTGSNDLLPFLKRIKNPRADKWFVHWQNCDINAVKALRKFYQRPYFLSTSVAPAHFNWILMSSDYKTNLYKKLELDSGLIILAQLRGSTSFKLIPHHPCNETCPQLVENLKEGEMLVFTNFLWAFEYFPGKHMDNIAILTETIWEDTLIV